MKLIPLTQGKFAIVDDDMFDELNRFKWFYHYGYARRNSKHVLGKKRPMIHMSRVVMSVPDGFQCDHISLNRCDNRRANLRVASHAQNNCNKHACKNNTSGAKGVDFRKWDRKYRARIGFNKKSIHLGNFSTLEEASVAYSIAAKKYHGEFANL